MIVSKSQRLPFLRNRKIHTKIHMEYSSNPNNQSSLKQTKKAGSLTLPDFKTYYKATVTQKIEYLHEDRHIHKWNKIESQEIKPYIYGYIIFNKRAKTIQLGKNSLVEKTGYPPVKE